MFLGPKFWKGNKKIKAVSEEDFDHWYDKDFSPYHSSGGIKQLPLISSSDEDDFMPSTSKGPPPKKKLKVERLDNIEERLKSVEGTLEKVKGDTESPSNIHQQLIAILFNNLKCLICKMLLNENPLILPCCNQIGCCEDCLKQWLNESTTCPHCRAPITMSSCVKLPTSLCGIISLLRQIEKDADSVIQLD